MCRSTFTRTFQSSFEDFFCERIYANKRILICISITFCISFFLRRVRTVKGMVPILARITVNGISKEVYTQCRTPVDKWDTAKSRATGRDKLAY